MKNLILPLFSALALSGCASYETMQTCRFVNEDGQFLQVSYEQGSEPHVTTFVSPANGKEMEYSSKLRVVVELPDGDSFKAYQVMNFISTGSLYKTDDERWIYLANGFTCKVLKLNQNPGEYAVEFEGVICESPEKSAKKNSKWRTVNAPASREYRKPALEKQ